MRIYDQFHDPAFGVLYQQISRMPGLESFVKTANVEASELEALPDTAFAWPAERRFPIHTPEHAAMSYAYSKVASLVPPFVESAIESALDVYGVSRDVFEETKVAAASDEDAYLLPDLKKIVVRSASDVKVAQRVLLEEMPKLDLEHRAVACGNLVKKASEFGVSLHPEMLKLAGFVVSNTAATRDWLEARAAALPDDARLFKLAYTTLADGLKNEPVESRDRGSLLKLASAIASLDEQSGLDRYYDRQLPDALRTVFNTEKHAASTVDICGSLVPVSKLASLPASFWEDLGGAELASEVAPGGKVDVSKLAEVVETLPLDLKTVIKTQLRV